MLTASGMANAQQFLTILTGSQEVPPVPSAAFGVTTFHLTGNEMEFGLFVFNGTAVREAHIHCAAIGVNGPIVVVLAGLIDAGLNVNGKWIGDAKLTDANVIPSACGTNLTELAQAMTAFQAYVNVHTVANPGGEVRGQIFPFSIGGLGTAGH